MKFEAHITFDRNVFHKLLLLTKFLTVFDEWKTSEIDGDPVLGQKVYGYFTSYASDEATLRERLDQAVENARKFSCPPVRAKIEQIIYDERFT